MEKYGESGATKVCPIDEERGPNGIEETESLCLGKSAAFEILNFCVINMKKID